MVPGSAGAHDGHMERLLAPPNGAHLVMVAVAFVARMLLGGIPIIGGLISFVLLLVILYHLAKIATNMIRATPTRV